MGSRWRLGLWAAAAAEAVVAAGFALEIDFVLELWPYGGSPLTHIFLGSVFAAVSASTVWSLLRGGPRAFAGIGLDALAILVPLTVYSLVRAAGGVDDAGRVAMFGAACAGGALVGGLLLREALRHEWRDATRTPPLVLWSFRVFVAALLVVAAMLLARRTVLPWPVTDDQSTVFGLMFVGAAAYFLFGLLEPRWENAGGQMAGFLAYDLVLIGPFLDRLPDVAREFRTELVLYTAVLVYSGLLAAWYLLLAPGTRLVRAEPRTAA